jgi:hypothetical protein
MLAATPARRGCCCKARERGKVRLRWAGTWSATPCPLSLPPTRSVPTPPSVPQLSMIRSMVRCLACAKLSSPHPPSHRLASIHMSESNDAPPPIPNEPQAASASSHHQSGCEWSTFCIAGNDTPLHSTPLRSHLYLECTSDKESKEVATMPPPPTAAARASANVKSPSPTSSTRWPRLYKPALTGLGLLAGLSQQG